MKLTTTNIVAIMASIAIVSVGGTFAFTMGAIPDAGPATTGGLFTGNVKVTQTDGDGNVIALRQSTNHITAQGLEMIMKNVFHGMNNTATTWPVPPVGEDDKVKYMEIGTAGEWNLLWNDTSLRNDVAGTCIRVIAAFTNVSAHRSPNSMGGSDDCIVTDPEGDLCRARMNVTAMSSFTGMACSVPAGGASIDEAGIFNDPDLTQGEMFARNTFGGVVLNVPDTLALDWEFTFTDS